MVFVALVALAASSCSNQPLLYGVQIDPAVIRPDGSGIGEQAHIQYALARRAEVSLIIVGADGQAHVLRDSVMRAPDHYETRFDGAVATGEGPDRQLLPDGSYTLKIRAVDTNGAEAEQTIPITVEGGDTTRLTVDNLVIQPTMITPNNDGEDDEAKISYSLSKKAAVTVFATDSAGNYSLIQPPKEQEGEAGLPAPWDGKENGGHLLANGTYTVHVQAVDTVGNVTETTQQMKIENGGTPQMVITKVKFWPPIVPISGTLRVEVTVKNIGDTLIKTLGPDPGTRYTLQSSYASFRDDKGVPLYFERPGRWRVGIMWNNAPQPYPVRWGFGKDLAPGDEVTVAGEIVFDTQLPRTGTFFWAGIEQGGVGFLDTNKGQTEIRISY